MTASAFVPETNSLKALREAAAGCRGCPLHGPATQTAGRELDAGLEHAGIARSDAYVTNVVKHFKFRERGKRRIHDTPKKSEVDACLPWLREELRLIKPQVLLILGAVAGKALLGSSFRLTRARGEPLDSDLAPYVIATIHPAAILRAPYGEARQAERAAFVDDLRVVAAQL